MNAQFKRGIIELCVLSILVEEDNYGYEIISKLSQHIDVSENTIYPILRRLTSEDYFKTYLQESNEGAPRKYYSMTEKGFIYYLTLREEWDEFIGGVYHIINQGGKKNEEIFRRFKARINEKKHE
ncbi:PadR family transcriptional regulator [Peloplasma aerotolerans]|uniref:PadR family transcriptional regulator n=1 Tax=Peloplasma aerotolerans TaxID=3044389 RepID=A0AAW6U9L2_9MOLU|nr:PadR family transcriptional regulator [Mariniplasma sp. M4Ah]MDI6452771.1 PadR family transcriptional regulator [Mariniplasma sp. M4Ah]MDR4968435.1 PadR family transcriptional regulator [Acholeplasmataceae bacterium]